MRLSRLSLATAMTAVIIAGAALAADMDIPRHPPTTEISVQKGPPNCSRWTDDCVNLRARHQGRTATLLEYRFFLSAPTSPLPAALTIRL